MLSFLYTELRGAIVYAFEQKTEYLDILFELLIEVYNRFEEEQEPDVRGIRVPTAALTTLSNPSA